MHSRRGGARPDRRDDQVIAELSSRTRRILSLFVALVVALTAGLAVNASRSAQAAPTFKVLAFYNGTWDAAHIDFVKEAAGWFPQAAAQNGFTWEATTDWSRLNTGNLAQYKVVLFLDDAPPADQRAAFQQYMQNGGGWMGFHVSAFTTDPNELELVPQHVPGHRGLPVQHLGSRPGDPADRGPDPPLHRAAPATFTSSVSEWYSWSNDLRQNPNIDILASIDPSSFPVGTDPTSPGTAATTRSCGPTGTTRCSTRTSATTSMNYSTNTRTVVHLRQRRAEPFADRRPEVAGRRRAPTPPTYAPADSRLDRPDLADRLVHPGQQDQRQVRGRPGGRPANGTAIQQYTCNGTTAQQFQFPRPAAASHRSTTATTAPSPRRDRRVHGRQRAHPALDLRRREQPAVARRSRGRRLLPLRQPQQWQVPRRAGASTADSVQLVQYTCNGTAAQSFRLAPQS